MGYHWLMNENVWKTTSREPLITLKDSVNKCPSTLDGTLFRAGTVPMDPYTYLDEDNNILGFETDIVKIMAEKYNFDLQLKHFVSPTHWETLATMVNKY
jgi:hypothetical protein